MNLDSINSPTIIRIRNQKRRIAPCFSCLPWLFTIVLALAAAPVRAAVLQCKFESNPPFYTELQDPDWEAELELSAGILQGRQGYWDDDIEAQEAALGSTGGTPHLYFVAAMNLALAYWHEGKFGPAISATNTALTTHVDDSLSYGARGLMYLNSLNLDQGISDETEAIKLDPCLKPAYATRALAYRRAHLTQQAISDEANVIAIDTDYIEQNPNDEHLYVTRGDDEDSQGAHDRAIADYSKAISLDSQYEAAFVDRGISYEAEGRYVDDVSDQTEAVTLKPKDAIAWNNLCWGLAVTGDLTDALSSCNEALALAPRDIDAWDSLGFVDLKMKNYTQAVADYGTVLKIDPEYASSLYGRGLAERKLGDFTDSIADITKAEKNDPDVATEFSK